MKIRRGPAAAAAVALLAGLLGTAGAGAAQATGTTPTYEPDPSAVGTVTLFDAAGTQITSGSVNDAPLATYYKASGPKVGSFAFNKGYVVYYTPQDSVPPGSWTTGEIWTAAQNYTTLQTSYPAGLNTPDTNVVIKGSASEGPFSSHITNFPSASVTDPGVYQLRLYTSASATTYYTADIKVTGTTWTQVYPAVATGTETTTTLGANPSGTVAPGTAVTLTATVAPAAAGGVTFADGATSLGAADSYNPGTGVATKTVTPTPGDHSYTATFAPTDTAAYQGSVSSAVALTVSKAAPTVALTLLPATVAYGTARSATVVVTATGFTPTGAVTVKEGAVTLASGTLSSGQATIALPATLAVKAHSLTASYAGDANVAAGSSGPATLSVVKATATMRAGVTTVKVGKAKRLALAVTLTARGTVPGGKVSVYEKRGKKFVLLGVKVLARGKAVVVLPKLKKGPHVLQARYPGSLVVAPVTSRLLTVRFP